MELSNIYGASFVGCEKEAFALLVKVDGRRNHMGIVNQELQEARGLEKMKLKFTELNEEVEGVRNVRGEKSNPHLSMKMKLVSWNVRGTC